MTPGELAKAISSGKFQSAYYFFGSEDFRMVEAEKFVAQRFLPESTLTTNFRRIDARKTKLPDLIAELSVYPMLGERQMFTIIDFQGYKPTELKRLTALLTPPDPNRVILFMTPSARAPKKNSALVKNMAQLAIVVEFNKLGDSEAGGNITAKFTKAGLTIEPDALARLIQMLAGSRGALVSETDKLINYKAGDPGGANVVTLADIQTVVAGHEIYSIFDLADLIIAGNLPKALKLVDRLLGEGGSATGLLFFVTQHFLTLYNLKNGKPLEAYRKFLTRQFSEQAAKFSMAEMEGAIVALADTDAELRQQRISGRLALEGLIVSLIDGRGGKSKNGRKIPAGIG
jgi:DNA polymerase-3 subunit delta